MTQQRNTGWVITDIEYAKYLLETLAPDLREAGFTATADDVENAGHRLLHAAEIVDSYANTLWPPMSDEALKAYAQRQGLQPPMVRKRYKRKPLVMEQSKGEPS